MLALHADVTLTPARKNMVLRRTVEWYEAYGTSWKGNTVKRNGEHVRCGHKHKTEHACRPCLRQMRRERPGKCQDYRICNLVAFYYKKAK